MSPRTQFALICKAIQIFYSLDRNIHKDDESQWIEQNSDILKYVKPEVQINLQLSQHLRQSFINIFFHIAEVIEKQNIPSIESIKENSWEKGNEQPHVPGFLFEDGTVGAAMQVVFEGARDCDVWAGSGDFEGVFGVECGRLVVCRNDHEWELVARMCGLRELGTWEGEVGRDV